ncbi:bifunctional sugar-1-phosphate nucleotidylyltransferase/acetyltransferase [Halobacterium yunchengense]|uniref:bifunctional sugar-1-phosphate nucleotidylyltransferase/acetyltransferase n=1 Tax=Halobacterium yunchengense TaxID=3108497 RepID=UPI00300A5942
MQTVLLAAGRGTRMGPLTDATAKPMLPVAGEPLVGHAAREAVAAGASRLVVVVGYCGDDVRAYFESFDAAPVTVVEQAEQRGTADAVRTAAPALADAPFAVLNGDVLYDGDLARLYENGPGVGAARVDDPSAYGVLETTPDGGRVTGVTEKPDDPDSDLVNAGAYVFPAAARDWLDVPASERGERELTAVLERACRAVDVTPVAFDRWLDVGRPWELLAANEWKLGELDRRVDGDVHPDADLRGDVVVEAGARVDAGVVLEGPALVCAGASVGPNAYVRGATVVGRDAKIGHGVEVKNSVFSPGATVGHLSYVGDSVLGRDVNLGAGTTVANLRHDDQPVAVAVNGDRVSTGRRKFGVVLGDGAKTGIQTSLNAGATLPAGATTAPGETVLFGPPDHGSDG